MFGLGNLKVKQLHNPKNITCFFIDINSIRNKFDSFCNLISLFVDIFSVAEAKVNNFFPNAQLLIPSFIQNFAWILVEVAQDY